jgi:hypothetical protein
MDTDDNQPIEERHREFVLAALRAAALKARLMETEINNVGVALKHNLVGPEMAIKWVHDLGLMWLVEPLPGVVGAVALTDVSEGPK